MTAELHQLKKKPDPDVVAFLEKALAQARLGETTGVMLLEQDANGVRYSIVGVTERFAMLGWLSHAMYRLQSDDLS